MAIMLMVFTGPALAADPCEVQGQQSAAVGPNALRLQGDVGPSVIGKIEAALGPQFGGLWFDNEGQTLSIGLTGGSMTVASATGVADATVESQVSPDESAFVKANTQVLSVPYSPAELNTAQGTLRTELLAALPVESFSIGQTVGEFAGPNSPGYWPQISVSLNDLVTEAQCDAVLPILQPYGAMASLRRTDEGPAVPVAEGATNPPPNPVTARPTPQAAGAVTASLGAAMSGDIAHLRIMFTRDVTGEVRITLRLLRGTHTLRTVVRTVTINGARSSTLAIRLPASTARTAARLRVNATLDEVATAKSIVATSITVRLAHAR